MRKIFPHPYMSLLIALVWLALAGVSVNQAALAVVLAIALPLATAQTWPNRPRLARPFAWLAYTALVLADVVKSSFAVARIILVLPKDQIASAFITVPIDLPSSEAIALLAGTITMTPGTLTAGIAKDGKSLLVHALHAPNPDAVRDQIKARYEARLKRIFA